jgi:hypothetical protein
VVGRAGESLFPFFYFIFIFETNRSVIAGYDAKQIGSIYYAPPRDTESAHSRKLLRLPIW